MAIRTRGSCLVHSGHSLQLEYYTKLIAINQNPLQIKTNSNKIKILLFFFDKEKRCFHSLQMPSQYLIFQNPPHYITWTVLNPNLLSCCNRGFLRKLMGYCIGFPKIKLFLLCNINRMSNIIELISEQSSSTDLAAITDSPHFGLKQHLIELIRLIHAIQLSDELGLKLGSNYNLLDTLVINPVISSNCFKITWNILE